MEQVEELVNKKVNKQPLSVTHPEIAKEWHITKNKETGKTPNEVTYGSNLRVFWRCSVCNHVYDAVIKKRISRGQNCPICKGKQSYLLKSKQVEITTLNDLKRWIKIILIENGYKQSETNSPVGYYFETRKVGIKENTIYILNYQVLGRESRYSKLEEINNLLKKHRLARYIKLQPDSILLKHKKLS